MKNWKRTLVMLTAAALAVGASAEERIWDFSDGLDGWRLSGGWHTEGGVLQQTADDRPYSYALVGHYGWDVRYLSANVRIDAPFHAGARHKVGILFRAHFLWGNRIRCYAYELLPREKITSLMTVLISEHGTATGVSRGGPVRFIELKSGEWYRIEIVLDGESAEFSINGFRQRSEDKADYVDQGAVGFFTYFAKASFDDLIVEGDNLQDLLSVQPHGKLAAQWARLKQE